MYVNDDVENNRDNMKTQWGIHEYYQLDSSEMRWKFLSIYNAKWESSQYLFQKTH